MLCNFYKVPYRQTDRATTRGPIGPNKKMSAKEAIKFVRGLRPRSVETRTQEKCLDDYETTLKRGSNFI